MQTQAGFPDALEVYLNKAKDLPPAPRVLTQLLGALDQPDTDSSQIVDVIKYDSALTARVLRTCNSAFFGAATPSDSL